MEFATEILKQNGGSQSIENNPDISIILPEGNSIKTEQIRIMQSKILEKPIISEKKVYIIDDSQTMTVQAQNCLLKTLEEPPEYIIIILISNNENNLLETIKSRCTKISFRKIEPNILKNYLQENGIIENCTESFIKVCNRKYWKGILT